MHLVWILSSYMQPVSPCCLARGCCTVGGSCTRAVCCVLLPWGEAGREQAACNGYYLHRLTCCWEAAGYYSNKGGMWNLLGARDVKASNGNCCCLGSRWQEETSAFLNEDMRHSNKMTLHRYWQRVFHVVPSTIEMIFWLTLKSFFCLFVFNAFLVL